MELGHFDKYFVKNTEKKTDREKNWNFLKLKFFKTTFWMENSPSSPPYLRAWNFRKVIQKKTDIAKTYLPANYIP